MAEHSGSRHDSRYDSGFLSQAACSYYNTRLLRYLAFSLAPQILLYNCTIPYSTYLVKKSCPRGSAIRSSELCDNEIRWLCRPHETESHRKTTRIESTHHRQNICIRTNGSHPFYFDDKVFVVVTSLCQRSSVRPTRSCASFQPTIHVLPPSFE